MSDGRMRVDSTPASRRPCGVGVTGRPRRAGLTLIELLMALAATGIIGVVIASMLAAVSYGTDASRNLRDVIVKGKTLNERMTNAVRTSRRLLAHEDDYFVLWTRDADANGEPSLREIQRIERDADADELVSYEAPDSAPDVPYTVEHDFGAITDALKGTAVFPGQTWGRQVVAWSVTLDEDEPADAKLMSFRLTLRAGEMEEVAIGAASLRND